MSSIVVVCDSEVLFSLVFNDKFEIGFRWIISWGLDLSFFWFVGTQNDSESAKFVG